MTVLLKKFKNNIRVPLFLIIVDIFLINAVFILSFLIRYGPRFVELDNFTSYKNSASLLTFVYMLAFVSIRVFKSRFVSFWDLFKTLFSALFMGTLFAITFIYVFRVKWASFPSSVFAIFFPLAVLIIFSVNGFILKYSKKIKKRIIIIGKKDLVYELEMGSYAEKIHIERIEDILKYDDIDEVIICEKIHDDKQMNLLTYLLLKLKVNVLFSPVIYAKLLSDNITEKNSIQNLSTFSGRTSDLEEFLIRACDMVGSIFMLILFSPLIVLIFIVIKITSSGTVLYKQERVSKDGKQFTLYKFNTMVEGAEKDTGPVLAVKNDPRVTKVGKFLRQTRLDEMPQLINVICGDMSLVGPRPERPYFVKRHKVLREIRLAVKPGLTGFSQIRNLYDLHPKHKIKYDCLYIQKRSLLLNLYILMKTIQVVFSKKGQ